MLAGESHNFSEFGESKIAYKSSARHPLARFVCEETVALLFDIEVEDIYRIECWEHIVYVHAKTVSRFVSYADFPPILSVEPPQKADTDRWKQRWIKKWKTKKAPPFWAKFYTQMFKQVPSVAKLKEWGKLVALVKEYLEDSALEGLRENYSNEKCFWDSF